MLPFRLRFPDPSPYSRPGFPCHLSGSVYSASCLFPFVLPCFAPTAVPQVLPFWITPRGSTLDFRFLSSTSVLASHYSASVSSFPRFPFPPHSWVPRCATVPFVPVAFPVLSCLVSHAFLPGSGTQPSCCSFLRFAVSRHRRYFSCRPPVSSSAAPLCFRFRFRLLGLSVLNFSVRLRPRIYYHPNLKKSTPILYIFQLSCCILQPIYSMFFLLQSFRMYEPLYSI